MVFLTPLRVDEGQKLEVHTHLHRQDDGRFEFVVSSPLDSEASGGERQEHALGEVAVLAINPSAHPSLAKILERCNLEDQQLDPGRPPLQSAVEWGPRWWSLRRICLGRDEALAELELPPELCEDLERFGLHPALLDVATACGLALLGGELYLPLSYRRLMVVGKLPAKIYSHVRRRGHDASLGEIATFDVTILDEHGNVLVDIEEFTLRRVNRSAFEASAASPRADVGSGSAATTDPALDDSGISPREGIDAFARILDHGTVPQIVVEKPSSPIRVESVQVEPVAETEPAAQQHRRPGLETPYAEPTNEIERTLVELLQQALGFERVGIYDNFFELGGHSVLAIRLIQQIRSEIGLDLPLNILFEAPTAVDLAAEILERLSREAENAELEQALAEIEELSDDEARALVAAAETAPARGASDE